MSYTITTMVRALDVDAFVAMTEVGKDVAMDAGATEVRANQIMMGGERAGALAYAFAVPTIATSIEVSAAINGDAEIQEVFAKTGAQLLSRSLMRVTATRGNTDGAYSTYLMMNGDPTDDATSDSYLADLWNHVSAGGNGIQSAQVYAAGHGAFNHGLITFTDDLDAVAAAAAQGLASPEVQSNITAGNISFVGRMIMRRLF
ncbi:MAG: hypothetical protein ACJ05G_07735 [Actinomycetota bacterium]|nr:hypothetical protein [Acidimicrobiales bacterium]